MLFTLLTRPLPSFVSTLFDFLARPYLTITETGSSTAVPEILCVKEEKSSGISQLSARLSKVLYTD